MSGTDITTIVASSNPADIVAFDLLSDEERGQAIALRNQTDIAGNLARISQFGAETEKAIAEAANPLLGQVRIHDAGDAGTLLLELTNSTSKLDFNLLKQPSGIMKLVRNAEKNVLLFLAQYDTLAGKIAEIEIELEKAERELIDDTNQIVAMIRSNNQQYRQHLIYIAAGEQILTRLRRDHSELQEELAKKQVVSQDEQERLTNLETAVQLFGIRVNDLKVLLNATMLATVNFQNMGKANLAQLLAIKRAMGPAMAIFKQSVAAMVLAMRASQRTAAVDAVNEMTNKAMLMAADATHTAAVGVAQSLNKSIVDPEVMRAATEKFVTTVREVRQEYENGEVMRAENNRKAQESTLYLQKAIVDVGSNQRYLKA